MKLTFVLLITAFLQVTLAASAQNVSLKEKSASIYMIFDKISKQTGYDFVYVNQMLISTKEVTINVKNEPIEQVLEKVFEGQELQYTIRNKTVIVQHKKGTLLDRFFVYINSIDAYGKVVDENGNPLAGASVKVNGRKQVSTDVKNNWINFRKMLK